MSQTPRIQISSTVSIPAIGLGTWQSGPSEVKNAVVYAIKEAGYRHIDCAWGYGNEKEVGEGIRESGIPRSEIFITSKLWGTYHTRVEECLDQTLANLGIDYLDLYLVHWPVAMNPNGNHPTFPTLPNGKRDVLHDWKLMDTWKQMEDLLKKGKARAIGVSNFSKTKLLEILPSTSLASNLDPSWKPTVIPAVNQLELHAYNPQHEELEFNRQHGIHIQAYSPLGSTNSPLLQDETVLSIAKERGITAADVLLGWLLSHQIVILPKSVTPARIKANLEGALKAYNPSATGHWSVDVPVVEQGSHRLTSEDIKRLDGLAESGKQKRFIMPPWPVDLGFANWPNKVL